MIFLEMHVAECIPIAAYVVLVAKAFPECFRNVLMFEEDVFLFIDLGWSEVILASLSAESLGIKTLFWTTIVGVSSLFPQKRESYNVFWAFKNNFFYSSQ